MPEFVGDREALPDLVAVVLYHDRVERQRKEPQDGFAPEFETVDVHEFESAEVAHDALHVDGAAKAREAALPERFFRDDLGVFVDLRRHEPTHLTRFLTCSRRSAVVADLLPLFSSSRAAIIIVLFPWAEDALMTRKLLSALIAR